MKNKTDDVNLIASRIIEETTALAETQKPEKNPNAVALGRLGGLKGGRARAKKLTAEQRKKIAIKAAKSRWGKKR